MKCHRMCHVYIADIYDPRQNENISELISILDAFVSFIPEAVQL